jgi:hypothetical protein
MTDAMLIEILRTFILPVAGLFGAVLILRWIALRLLYRFAPPWLVGPHGLLIDTKTKMGMLQMRDDLHGSSGGGAGGGGGGSSC